METYKKAALYLHGMDDDDASWMLQKLPEDKSVYLKKLMDELSELGIPKERTLLSDVGSEDRKLLINDADTECSKLSRVESHKIITVFETESDELLAFFLSIYPWAWKQDVLSGLGLKEQRVKHLMNADEGVQVTDRAKQALIRGVHSLVSQQLDVTSSNNGRSRKAGY